MNNQVYSATYKAEVAKFTKKDGIIALCFLPYYFVMDFFVIGFLFEAILGSAINISETMLREVFHYLWPIFWILPVFVIIALRKQKLFSVGIHKKHLRPALLLGLVFSAISFVFLYSGLLPGFIQGGQLRPLIDIVIHILTTTLILAAWEDIVFVGFIQTRLHGLIKNNILAVFVGGLIFAAVHWPVWAFTLEISLLRIIVNPLTVGWIGMHIIHNLLFRKYFSIIPVIMFHTFINASQGLLWESGVSGLNDIISFTIITLAVILWAICSYRKGKKTSTSKQAEESCA